ncbi:MAG: hypothetical protein G5Z42_04830 [Caldisphaeraceae archaeon]|nr:hypothetical protein [Caldisphaeraceae archaeon]MEB3691860.1 hypothetical protein [Caldisphaeraceae archaeon]MEB3798126.1 hypothetical protein [Caldisphaeraceae archaeon]
MDIKGGGWRSFSLDEIESISEKAKKTLKEMSKYDEHIHLESSLSSLKAISTIILGYWRDSDNPIDRDWFILSKGHAAPALYAVLAEVGLLDKKELFNINKVWSPIQNHPDLSIPFVGMTSGSLAQGLSFSLGISAWIKMKNGKGRVFTLMGDGEQDEGQVWEAITYAPVMRLGNLTVIVDLNRRQLDGSVHEIKPKDYMPLVWKAVGWNVIFCDGHNVRSIAHALENALASSLPSVVFAETSHVDGGC